MGLYIIYVGFDCVVFFEHEWAARDRPCATARNTESGKSVGLPLRYFRFDQAPTSSQGRPTGSRAQGRNKARVGMWTTPE